MLVYVCGLLCDIVWVGLCLRGLLCLRVHVCVLCLRVLCVISCVLSDVFGLCCFVCVVCVA